MKTRIVEIPVCDKCARDGEILVVTNATGEGFTICRCPRHVMRLRAEADVTDEHAVVRSQKTAGHEADGDLVEVVRAHSGQTAKFYAEALGVSTQKVGKMAQRLIEAGSLRREGRVYVWV